ncbi:MAG TPA: hypothetical protein DD379_09615, partial [Cyanobacteria bacterium UBA11162]|nr:hypothetical protein [Cyanobacteria bacterium UBA11162]
MFPFFLAQITPTLPTEVRQIQQEFIIEGGTVRVNNLFHSFEQLNLENGELANFISNPDIFNILVKVNGGSSIIDGILKVTGGSSNLFLLNPSGIVFGENAQVNVPAGFYASTAGSIRFDNGLRWTGLPGTQFPQGNPTALIFSRGLENQVINLGIIEASKIDLSGGSIINFGNLTAEDIRLTTIAPRFTQRELRLNENSWTITPGLTLTFPEFDYYFENETLLINTSSGSTLIGIKDDQGDVKEFNLVFPASIVLGGKITGNLNTYQIGGGTVETYDVTLHPDRSPSPDPSPS